MRPPRRPRARALRGCSEGLRAWGVFPPSPPCTPDHPASSAQILAIAIAIAIAIVIVITRALAGAFSLWG
jgi:hypothetical protein